MMQLKDFVGQVVISTVTKERYKLKEITAPEICVITEKTDSSGYPECYVYRTINGDPISAGTLVFENLALTAPFKVAFEAYCHTEEARWENYSYWMRRA